MGETYEELVADTQRARELMKGSCVTTDHPDPITSWERGRRFISSVITHDGTILDIGCANGLLLKSFEAWVPFELTPYGIDNSCDAIDQARTLFPEINNNFVCISLENVLESNPRNFPVTVDFIYWGVWTNFQVEKELIDRLLKRVNHGGKLILGFYPDSAEEQSDVRNNVGVLINLDYPVIVQKNTFAPERNEKVAIIEK